MIAIVREYLIQFVCSASSESSALWQCRINTDVTAILSVAGDDPLSQMYAEVIVLAWLDVMRCSIMPSLPGQDVKRSSHWQPINVRQIDQEFWHIGADGSEEETVGLAKRNWIQWVGNRCSLFD